MRVVADSQALVRYLVDPAGLSEPALDALLDAEDSDGVIVSVATLTYQRWFGVARSKGFEPLPF